MKKWILLTTVLSFLTNFTQFQRTSIDLVKLRTSAAYLQGVKTLRMLFIALIAMGICIMLVMTAFVLLYFSVLFYAPISAWAKLWLSLGLSLSSILASVGIFHRFFSEDKWMEMFRGDELVDTLTGTNGKEKHGR